jgi:hypothetical protein
MHHDGQELRQRAAAHHDDRPTRTLTHEQFLHAKARALQNLDHYLARLRFQGKAG